MGEVRTIDRQDQKKLKKAQPKKSLKELRVELQKLILEVGSGKEKNSSLIRKTKREIARILNNSKVVNNEK